MLANRGRNIKIVPIIIFLIPFPFIIFYFFARFQTFFSPGYTIVDRIISVLLFAADFFFLMHTVAYLLNFLRSQEVYPGTIERYFKAYTRPSTAVLIATFNEPPEVVEKTVIAASISANRIGATVFLLDDSTNREVADALRKIASTYGAKYIHRTNRHGFKAGAMNEWLRGYGDQYKYFTVLDSDQRPIPEYLVETVSMLEADPSLALVQVPQIYTNTDSSRLAQGAQYVQQVFFDYITEGKSVTNSMFSCGSNTIFRTEAVKGVGGFDETSVTEDMATSIKIHQHGWKSKYYNRPLVMGEGPSTLDSYFTQQGRWSLGSMGLCFRVVKNFILHPRSMSPLQWLDYFVTTTWYFVGIVYVLMLAGLLVFVFFGLTPIITTGVSFFFFLIPYIVFNMLTFTLTVLYKGNPVKSVLYNLALTFVTVPIYVISTVNVLLNRKKPFKVTPKNMTGGKLPLSSMYLQLTLFSIILLGMLVSAVKYAMSGNVSFIVVIGWLSYYLILSAFAFYFNTNTKVSSFYVPVIDKWEASG
ncbi:MAG: glycosyltransferase [Nitrososphaerota archaeon]|nr:glycosyltransferase [Nitrososphaerota archaeon]